MAEDSPGGGRTSLADEVRGLIAGAREWLRSEIDYQTARASLAGRTLGRLALLALLALALVFFALIALVVGLLLGLTPVLGPSGAMAVVIAGLLASAGLCLLGVRRLWARFRRLISGGDEAR